MSNDARVDLEIELSAMQTERCRVRLRLDDGPSTSVWPAGDRVAYMVIDEAGLLAAQGDMNAYGRLLGDALFADPDLRAGFAAARDRAEQGKTRLRVRLHIGGDAVRLHLLRWETLIVPSDSQPLALQEQVLFSRFLAARGGPLTPRRGQDLRALIVVANPTNYDQYALAWIDVAAEVARARAALGSMKIAIVGEDEHATLEVVKSHLRDGCDILYHVAHGGIACGVARVVLQDDEGNADFVAADALANAVVQAGTGLRLVVLASCASAGAGEGNALAALGPLIVGAGVPAVVGMQGDVSIPMVDVLMPRLLGAVCAETPVDWALALARQAVQELQFPDWWAPVLWMRLREGRLLALPSVEPAPTIPIPPPAPTLFGRAALLDRLAGAVRHAPTTALVGTAGVGKTALALGLANHPGVVESFGDGRAWVALGPRPDVYTALGRLLGEMGQPVAGLDSVAARTAALRTALTGRNLLLVVDDVWEKVHAQPFVDACQPPTHVVLTTRDAHLADDLHAIVQPVPILARPDALAMLSSAGTPAHAAVEADPAAADRLALRLGDLPLALHVAGRRLSSMARSDGARHAAAHLDRDLQDEIARLLALPAADPRPGIAGDHPTLAAVIDLSYRVLPPAVQRAFARLAVCGAQPLDVDATALQAVWEEADAYTADGVRMALVDAGLLERRAEEGDGISAPRYYLHQMLSIFAGAQLAQDGATAQAAALAYARHFAAVVAGYDDAITAGKMTYAVPFEWENVAHALDWLEPRCAADEDAAQAMLAFARHWRNVLFNHHDVRRARWLEAAVGAARCVQSDGDLANVLQAQGDVLYFLKQTTDALAKYEAALGLFRAVGARLGEANAIAAQGQVILLEGEQEDADEKLAQAIALYQAIGDRYSIPAQIGNYGWALRRHDQPDRAHPYLLQAADLFEAMGLADYAERHRRAAQPKMSPAEAKSLLEQAATQARVAGDLVQLAEILKSLLDVCQKLEDWQNAAGAAEELVVLGAADALTWTALGDARSRLENAAGAAEAYASAVALAPDAAMLRRNYANMLIELGTLDEAAAQLDAAEALEPDAPYLALRRAELAKARGDRAAAVQWSTAALRRQPAWDQAQAILDWAEGNA